MAALLIAIGCWLAAARAHADPPAPLGTTGQWLVDGSVGGSYEQRTTVGRPAPGLVFLDVEHFGLWLAPSALHFVATDFALGGALHAGFDRYDRSDGLVLDEVSYGASAAIAYRAGLAPRVFLLPKLTIGGMRIARSATNDGAPTFGETPVALRPLRNAQGEALLDVEALHAILTLPIAFSPADGLFFGIGPYVHGRYALSGILASGARDWLLSLGIATDIGFWL